MNEDKICECGHKRKKHNYDFTEECSECSGGQCPRFKLQEEMEK